MSQRIFALSRFLFVNLITSLPGLIYLLLTLLIWAFFFPPNQGTPDVENYILIIGAWGAAITFLITLTVASRANETYAYPFLVRLPSKVEYLTAVLLTSLFFATCLQLLLALLAIYNGPTLTPAILSEIPPIWIAVNILTAVLSMHASDFVTSGWSRVYVYGLLAILLMGQNGNQTIARWLAGRSQAIARFFSSRDIPNMGETFRNWGVWLNSQGVETIDQLFGFVFWPFRAIADATIVGGFNPSQALAPAILLLYASILFMLAADLFANKDMDFNE